MVKPANPLYEKERMAAFQEYQIREMQAGKEFEDLTMMACQITQTPISVISLMDRDKQWLKAGVNLAIPAIPFDNAFYSHAINHPYEPFIIQDMRKDERFADHPLVIGEPHVVFYTGIPLNNPDGYTLGALCVFDKVPKTLTESQIQSLQMLARQVVQLLELRKAGIHQKLLKETLESRTEELQQFAYVVSHDIKSPLASIVLASEMLRENFGESIDEGNDQLLKVLNRASFKIKKLVDGILAYYRAEKALSEGAEFFQLKPFLLSIAEMLTVNQAADIIYPQEEHSLYLNKTALEQIFINLLQNAIKYNDSSRPRVIIQLSEDDVNYYFTVSDNGRGIASSQQEKILKLFTTQDTQDRFGIQGPGIGLSTVKKLVEKMSGKIKLKTVPGQGSEFSFSLKKEK